MADSRKRKLRLMEKNPHCYWCKELVKDSPLEGGSQDGACATLDHLYSRLDPRRWERVHNEERTVLACYKCNQQRNNKERNQIAELFSTGIDPFAKDALLVTSLLLKLPLCCRPHPRSLRKYIGDSFEHYTNPHKGHQTKP